MNRELIHFKYDQDKAFQVVMWFLRRHGGSINKLKLIKLVFFADREHLFKYGRPIIGGDYYALPHGPVLSQLLDQINEHENTPFDLNGYNVVETNQKLNEDFFSESDIEVLIDIDNSYGTHDKFHLRDETHNLKAYLGNEPAENSSKNLPYEDFFLDIDDKSMLEIILDEQKAWKGFM